MIFLKQLKLLKIESHDKLNFKKGLFSHIFYLRPPSLAELKVNLKVPIYQAKKSARMICINPQSHISYLIMGIWYLCRSSTFHNWVFGAIRKKAASSFCFDLRLDPEWLGDGHGRLLNA